MSEENKRDATKSRQFVGESYPGEFMIDENAKCGGPDPRYIEIIRKRSEILNKLTNGIENYQTHALYQKVVDSLARGADPIMIIEQLIDINIAQSQQLIKMYQHEPVFSGITEEQANEFLKTIKK